MKDKTSWFKALEYAIRNDYSSYAPLQALWNENKRLQQVYSDCWLYVDFKAWVLKKIHYVLAGRIDPSLLSRLEERAAKLSVIHEGPCTDEFSVLDKLKNDLLNEMHLVWQPYREMQYQPLEYYAIQVLCESYYNEPRIHILLDCLVCATYENYPVIEEDFKGGGEFPLENKLAACYLSTFVSEVILKGYSQAANSKSLTKELKKYNLA